MKKFKKMNALKIFLYKIPILKTQLTIVALLLICGTSLSAQEVQKYTLSGHVKDRSSGEELIEATVYVKELSTGNTTNVYGFYSLTLPQGSYQIVYGYLGFEDMVVTVDLDQDIRQDVDLSIAGNMISEITIVAEEEDINVQSTEMSKVTIDVAAVQKIPALFGEVDIIKAIQLLPGVKTIGEGSSGFYVRGGNADQNLVLLDEAPIYNASHLLGFFSSFNPDAIKDMQLYKGAIPARYGGRLSSVLDIRMKEGNSKKFGGSAGIGLIMSRLSLEAPLSENGSFILSGRRSYIDLMSKAYLTLKGEDSKDQFYFYDLNAKGNYRFNENNRLFVSGYFGKDIWKQDEDGINFFWGNKTATVRWNHIFSPKLFSNITAYYSNYNYGLKVNEELSSFDWSSTLEEVSLKADFTAFISPEYSIDFGIQSIKHDIAPGTIKILDSNDSITDDYIIEEVSSIENAIYISNEWDVNDKLSLTIGLRGSSLHNTGPQTHYISNNDSEIIDSTVYTSGVYNSYYNLEPRLGVRYSLDNDKSLKASYNRTAQYIQQASNGNISTPFDIWFNATPTVKPQVADQYAVGYFQNFKDNSYEASVELYYKDFSNAIDFKEGAQLLLNKNLEGELRIGTARAYGAEFMVKKDIGKVTGWISYTYSKIEKKIASINNDDWYNAKYDKPHDLSLVLSFDLSDRIRLSSNFVYSSGATATFPTGKYDFGGTSVPIYSERNGERLPDFHRMDVSMSLKSKNYETKRIKGEWVFGIYNVYNRKNALAINFKEDNTGRSYAEKSSVFAIVPSITYNLKF